VTEASRFDAARFLQKYQPHWSWAVMLLLVPGVLIALGFAGLHTGSRISYGIAATAPKVAVLVSLGGVAAALARRRRAAAAVAFAGLTLSGVGFLLLLWLGK
jgi:hypothetical protein